MRATTREPLKRAKKSMADLAKRLREDGIGGGLSAPSREDWSKPGQLADLLPTFGSWHFPWLDVPGLIQNATQVLEWPMVDRDPLPFWTRGRITLAGSLPSLQLSAQAKLGQGGRVFDIQTAAQCGRAGEDAWKARIETVQVRSASTHQSGTWTAQLAQPLAVDWTSAPPACRCCQPSSRRRRCRRGRPVGRPQVVLLLWRADASRCLWRRNAQCS